MSCTRQNPFTLIGEIALVGEFILRMSFASVVVIVLGIVALNQVMRDGSRGKGFAVAGIAVGAVGTVILGLLVIGITADGV